MPAERGPSGTGHDTTRHDTATARRKLRDYVTGWINLDRGVEENVLADLVADAPAFQTLNAEEWWNVALMLAFEVRRAR